MNRYKIEIKWATLFSLTFMLWNLAEKLLGLHDAQILNHATVSYFFIIVVFAYYVIALYDKKKNYFANNMNWSQGFVTGCYLSLFICIQSPLTHYINLNLISPDFFKNAIAYVTEAKLMTPVAAQEYFNLKSYMIQGAFGNISFGIVTAAIVAYFLRTKQIKTTK